MNRPTPIFTTLRPTLHYIWPRCAPHRTGVEPQPAWPGLTGRPNGRPVGAAVISPRSNSTIINVSLRSNANTKGPGRWCQQTTLEKYPGPTNAHPFPILLRLSTAMDPSPRRLSRDDYTAAIICPMGVELAAAERNPG
jgi:hypothetical protein